MSVRPSLSLACSLLHNTDLQLRLFRLIQLLTAPWQHLFRANPLLLFFRRFL